MLTDCHPAKRPLKGAQLPRPFSFLGLGESDQRKGFDDAERAKAVIMPEVFRIEDGGAGFQCGCTSTSHLWLGDRTTTRLKYKTEPFVP